MYLAMFEQFLFWGGLIVFLVSLAMYAGRTKDFQSLLYFWQPTVSLNKTEFLVNRVGMSMMIVALMVRFYLFMTM